MTHTIGSLLFFSPFNKNPENLSHSTPQMFLKLFSCFFLYIKSPPTQFRFIFPLADSDGRNATQHFFSFNSDSFSKVAVIEIDFENY